MNQLNSDTLGHVHHFLSVAELLELRRVDKNHLQIPIVAIFRQRLVTAIMRVCNVTKRNAHMLLAACNLRGGVISGSIVLQVLLGEVWESDIDIYVNTRHKLFYTMEFLVNVIRVDPSMELLRDKKENYISPSRSVITTFECGIPLYSNKSDYIILYNYAKQHVDDCLYEKIQVIGTNRDTTISMHNATTSHFDMSIVSNSYFKGTLEVFCREMLVAKKTSILNIPKHGRIEKYTERGISFTPIDYDTHYFNIRNSVMKELRGLQLKRDPIVAHHVMMRELMTRV
jgi:hypothetical protein